MKRQKLNKLNKKLITSVDCPLCNSKNKKKLYQVFDHEYQTSSDFFWQNKCLNCGFVYLSPRPNNRSLSIIYPNSYSNFDITVQDSYTRKVSNFFQSKSIKKSLLKLGFYEKQQFKVIDVGCGDGSFLNRIKESFPNALTYGVEPNSKAVNLARKNGHKVFDGYIEDYKDNHNCFDIVFSSHVIEHVHDPKIFLLTLKKLAKKNTYVIVETPNIDCFAHKIFKSDWGGHHAPRHWTIFDKKTLVKMAKETNLGIVSIKDVPINIFIIWSIHSYLYRRNHKLIADKFFHTSDCLKKKSLYYFALLCFCELLERVTKLLGGQLGQLRAVFRNS